MAAEVDWSIPPEYLDTELQEVVRDADLGKQRVDKLIRVQLLDGSEEWVLIHVEVQAQPDEDLPRRLYQYHHRIADRFGRRVATLAVLADERAQWRPYSYSEELWGCRVRFEYPVCKLLDLAGGEPDLNSSMNPAAIVVAAHLAAQETRGDMELRKKFKWQITRRLYQRGWEKKDILELFRLVDWLLVLPDKLELEFDSELIQSEQESNMPHIMSFERLARDAGREEGRQEGREEGRQEGRRQGVAIIVTRQARKKFPDLTSDDENAIGALPLANLELLGEALLDFSGLQDFRNWINIHR